MEILSMSDTIIRKKLPLELKKHGFLMRQIKRSDDVAIYSKGGGFEVVMIQRHDGYEIKGVKIEPSEFLPKDEDFGFKGWYYSGAEGRERAEEKWRSLNG